MKNLRWKPILRWDPQFRALRLCRVMWERGEGPGIAGPGNYSAKLSLALRLKLLAFERAWDGFDLTLAGVRVHLKRNHGGLFV